MKSLANLRFDNSFARLPDGFHSRVAATPLAGTHLISLSAPAAALLDMTPEQLHSAEGLAWLSGQVPLPGGDPVAMCYAGHQFGHYVPQLGDGRALILGEVCSASGEHWELQLKGSGLTPYSRAGDGRAVLRSSIREYLCSEAMHALGIPTTRALCLFGSDEPVYRESLERGALLVRMAPSHVRFGSFELFYHRQRYSRLRQLADYVIDHDYPHLREVAEPHAALLGEIIQRTAKLIAQWQLVGFVHGVMNTDNMSALGLTLDYGPFGFMEAYDPGLVCNHSDDQGRYAFDQQPVIGLWNLTCLAQAMLPLLDADHGEVAAERAHELLDLYQPALSEAYVSGLRAKLGLRDADSDDYALANRLLDLMAADRVDYTNLFRELAEFQVVADDNGNGLRERFTDRAGFDAWAADYRARLHLEQSIDPDRRAAMRAVNPRYVLRNYLAQKAIEQAERGEYAEVDRLLMLLARPFDDQPEFAAYAAESPDGSRGLAMSCSS